MTILFGVQMHLNFINQHKTTFHASLYIILVLFISACAINSSSTIRENQDNDSDFRENKQTNWSALHRAVAKGDINQTRDILTSGANVNIADAQFKITPLHLVAEAGDIKIVNLLLNRGADANAKEARVGATPLQVAVQHGHVEVIDKLLAHPKTNVNLRLNSGYSAIDIAVIQDNMASVKSFIKAKVGLDVDQKLFSPLHLAAERGNTDIARLLINAGVNVNAQGPMGLTPLHRAAQQDHVEMVKYLLKHKAKVNARHQQGSTPLLVSAVASCPDVAKVLLKAGANINATNSQKITPLHAAASNGDFGFVKLLLNRRHIKINGKQRGGYTPLHLAAKGGHEIVVSMLLKKGAGVNIKSDLGFSPLDLAFEYDRKTVIETLKVQGGR